MQAMYRVGCMACFVFGYFALQDVWPIRKVIHRNNNPPQKGCTIITPSFIPPSGPVQHMERLFFGWAPILPAWYSPGLAEKIPYSAIAE